MRHLHRVVTGVALLAIGLCGRARGQALEQAPSDSVGVFEVRNLQELSGKVAKFAKTLGIDQISPDWNDPLGALTTRMQIKQGLNRDGDMAVAFLKPAGAAGGDRVNGQAKESSDEPGFVAIIPVSDYKAFLGNLKDVQDEGDGVSKGTGSDGQPAFVVERGKYAAVSNQKSSLTDHGGVHLPASVSKEMQDRDAILYFDLKAVRSKMQEGYRQFHDMVEKMSQPGANPNLQMSPAVMAIFDKVATQFLSDTESVAFSFNLNDTGISAAFLGGFESGSYLGKLATQQKNTSEPLLAGLPDRPYLFFGGGALDPAVMRKILDDLSDAVSKGPDQSRTQDLTSYVNVLKKSLAAMKSQAAGAIAPAAGENFMQIVTVARGDAKQIMDAQKDALKYASSFMGTLDPKQKMDVKFGDPTNVGGVDLQTYRMTIDFDPSNPMAAQQKQMMTLFYGPNGMSGVMGAVNDHTFFQTMGVNDRLLPDLVAAAKSGEDKLDQNEQVKLVAGELPKERVVTYYLALDNVATSVVNLLRTQGLAVQFRLPPNLPPIGVTAGTQESSVRLDAIIPTRLVESITAAAMQVYSQMNGGGAGGRGGV